ncbi:MAG: hypothetical protein KF842_08740 [Caulobacter sp.]|nr:hypothetical protein [Caulobacter sp.]
MTPTDEERIRRGLEAAGKLAALSPQTQARMIEWDHEGIPTALLINVAFLEIGRAIASKRNPVSDSDLKLLFAEIERLLRSSDEHISNAVATDLLEAVWLATHQSGFDFSRVNPHLGEESRAYLIQWDAFQRTRTPGLKTR